MSLSRISYLAVIVLAAATMGCDNSSSDAPPLNDAASGADTGVSAGDTGPSADTSVAIDAATADTTAADTGTVDVLTAPGDAGALVDIGGMADGTSSSMPNLDDGPNDSFAQQACQNSNTDATPIIAAESVEEAAQALLVPGPEAVFSVTIPASGTGFVTVEITDWQIIVAVFADYTTTVTILDPEGKTALINPLSWNSACKGNGMTDERHKYHKWGAFTFKLEGAPGSELWLSLIEYK